MNLTEYFSSLKVPSMYINKYTTFAQTYGKYKVITPFDIYKYDWKSQIENFLLDEQLCIAMPNMIGDEVVGLCLRSLRTKAFRPYMESKYIPYGAGKVLDKPYDKPWILVESALDSDFLRLFYPYVIATLGVGVSHYLMEFCINTSESILLGFDNDNAGDNGCKTIVSKYYKPNKFRYFRPPKPYKDFGDILELLHKGDIFNFELYVSLLKNSLALITDNVGVTKSIKNSKVEFKFH